MSYLYCQNPSCGVYLGSLGADQCGICGWACPSEPQASTPPAPRAPSIEPVAQAEAAVLPGFIRREVERAIDAAVNPKGMGVHDGKAIIGADKLRYLLAFIDTHCTTPLKECTK